MTEAYKIDHTKGELRSEVSAQWASRSDDERFLSLTDLRLQVATWAQQSHDIEVTANEVTLTAPTVMVDGKPTLDPVNLRLAAGGENFEPTNYAFSQLAQAAEAPADYLRSLPAPLAAVNINYGLAANAGNREKSLYVRQTEQGDKILRAMTSTKYGRIFDRDVVDAVMKIAGNGTGDTRWKVPGTIEWGSEFGVAYNPNVDITKQNTTLYASDRDLFIFLVDDRNPIEVGKLDDGSPDLMFRGFYTWNSEVGNRTYGVATMYLRGVCQNRNLWGVEGFNEVTFKHTAGAPNRFMTEAAPALEGFTETSPAKLIAGVKAAKAAVVAETDEERVEFLMKFGFGQKKAAELIGIGLAEEGHPPSNVWDFAQAVTAYARTMDFQEARIEVERRAGLILDRVTA
jgi:hypothetical protein